MSLTAIPPTTATVPATATCLPRVMAAVGIVNLNGDHIESVVTYFISLTELEAKRGEV